MLKPAITEFLKTFTEYADLYIGIEKKTIVKARFLLYVGYPSCCFQRRTPPPTHTHTPTPINPPLTLSDFSPFQQCCLLHGNICGIKEKMALTFFYILLFLRFLLFFPLSLAFLPTPFFLRNLRAYYHFNCPVT